MLQEEQTQFKGEHTPRPWRFEWPMPDDMDGGIVVLAANARSGFQPVAECLSPDSMEADARLIAAAPDLLAACARLVELACEEGWDEFAMFTPERNAVEAGQAAIGHAEGTR